MDKKFKLPHEFIQERVDSYPEPQRLGTRKGDPIGLSKIKYAAALHGLTYKKPKEIAEEVGVSYGLLRKWGTEKEFVSVLQQHLDMYAQYCFHYLSNSYDEKGKYLINKFLEQPMEEIAQATCSHVLFEEFPKELKISPVLLYDLARMLLHVVTNRERDVYFDVYLLAFVHQFLLDIRVLRPSDMKHPFFTTVRELFRSLRETLYREMRIIMRKKTITLQDRKLVVFYSRMLEITEK